MLLDILHAEQVVIMLGRYRQRLLAHTFETAINEWIDADAHERSFFPGLYHKRHGNGKESRTTMCGRMTELPG
jgi:hypothetical protein